MKASSRAIEMEGMILAWIEVERFLIGKVGKE